MSPILGIYASSQQTSKLSNYYSISTATVTSGGASTITFSSIPSTYTHLQIRGFGIGASYAYFSIKANSDTGSNYAYHQLTGDGSSVTAGSGISTTTMYSGQGSSSSSNGSVAVVDVLDYANTNKYKTFRTLTGYDSNGTGGIWFRSGLWQNTSAITQIDLIAGSSFGQYSSFALYGVK